MSRFWSKSVQDLTPYTPGEQPQIDNLIKLNTNENPYGPSPKVLAAIKEATSDDLRKYPDPNAQQLKDAVAKNYDLRSNQVFVGNSSDEVLAHVFRGLLDQDKPILTPDISYSFYPVWCQLFNIEYQNIPLREDFSINLNDYAKQNGGIIFANPNAPTGIALSLDDVKTLVTNNTDSVVVMDEAYADFGDESAINLIDQFPNLLVVQTLSKSRSLAGLRVGIACGSAELIEGLERVKNSFHPYALNQLAIAGATAAFEDTDYFNQTRLRVIQTRESTINELKGLGFSCLPSQTNFVMAKHKTAKAAELFAALREKKIIVRYFSAPRIENYIRISIGTEEEMEALIAALSEIVSG
ncbi:MAG: histidinol-phosphate transaminase [Acidiferrobacterales bacterium]|nr:histidinol-phosphate transaminase [Acidiferrobacterales bacterium]